MSVTANWRIRERRLSLGLSGPDIAKAVGLTIHEYDDVEHYEDEFVTAISLSVAKRLCTSLKIDILDLVGLPPVNESETGPSRKILIENSRRAKGMSSSELADSIGFDEEVIEMLEGDANFLEGWPLDLAISLAEILQVDTVRLIAPDV